jgi:hypothetical protein
MYLDTNCNQVSIEVHDEDLLLSSDYIVDVYLDSDTSSATRFGRYNYDSIVINDANALFPDDTGMHSILLWIVDFDSNGNRINNGVNGWVGPYTYSWNRSFCGQQTLNKVAYES